MADTQEAKSKKNIAGRSIENHEVDLNCVKININGLVNNKDNIRCKDNNNTGDGFVYTCKTTKNSEGKYEYDYKDTGLAWKSDKLSSIAGHNGEDARDTTVSYIREKKNSDKYIGEGVINILDDDENIRGKLTGSPTKNFIYNEGNSTKLGDGKNEDTNVPKAEGIQVKSISNDKEYTITKFYDQQAVAFKDHPVVTAIRNLQS